MAVVGFLDVSEFKILSSSGVNTVSMRRYTKFHADRSGRFRYNDFYGRPA